MPSKKPQFVIRTEQEILDKIKYIAEQNERSATQETIYLYKQHIKKYEKENGEIILNKKIKEKNNTTQVTQTINNNGNMSNGSFIGIQNNIKE